MCWMDQVQEAVVLETEEIHRCPGRRVGWKPHPVRDVLGHPVNRRVLRAVERQVEKEFGLPCSSQKVRPR
jgi:glycerate-2-kinase